VKEAGITYPVSVTLTNRDKLQVSVRILLEPQVLTPGFYPPSLLGP